MASKSGSDKQAPPEGPVPIEEGLFKLPSSPSEKPYLIGTRCRSCGETSFPTRILCRKCSSSDLEEVALGPIGKLYAFTTIRVKAPHYIGPVPYFMGIVELPEGERLRTLLTDCDQESLEVGMDMELVIESVGKSTEPIAKYPPGTEILGWKFRPLRRKQ